MLKALTSIMAHGYDHSSIEPKWQKRWLAERVFSAPTTPSPSSGRRGGSQYVLDMFPYPSGDGLHVGHPEGYTATDIYSRYLRMTGVSVLHPMGWDAFGLPAENAAIAKGVHPSVVTAKNVANFKRQIQSFGFSYDWDREVNTTDPAYYKWTQWIFLQLYKRGLAYEKESPIWWCPKDKTGLANEEVVDGKCDRCGTAVEKKMLRQWVLKITAYADRLLSGLDKLDWPESIKALQRNWIGKSEGAEVTFDIDETQKVKRIVILHGRQSTSKDHFYPKLRSDLESKGFEVQVPDMPEHNGEPDDEEQASYALKQCTLDEQTVVVGHSFGGIVALRLLERGVKLNGLVLVATPYSGEFIDKVVRPTVTAATKKGFRFSTIKKNCGYFEVIAGTNDSAVPLSDSNSFAKHLGVKATHVVSNKPHFQGEDEPSVLKALIPSVTVFTTRPDTLFGATYLVLAPEHELVGQITSDKQKKAVEKYVKSVAAKSDLERTSLEKEKTGVFTGAFAVNPVNNEKIPVWIADYVLSGYGTGAIMAVPAHDERDWAFATKYELPIPQVVAPIYINTTDLALRDDAPTVVRRTIYCIVRNPKNNTYLCHAWKKNDWKSFVTGGIEEGEDIVAAGQREVTEETGYTELKHVRTLDWQVHTKFFAKHKNENRHTVATAVVYDLIGDHREEIAELEDDQAQAVWLPEDKVREFLNFGNLKFIWDHYLQPQAYVGEGIMVNSGQFDGLTSEEGRQKIVAWLENEGKAKFAVNYKLRDWVFSRQRYWGEPIPLVHCKKCGVVPVPEKELPLKLPEVEKYEPTGTGESPLAAIDEWVNTTCPKCGGPAKRETNTMPQWAGSCWYYLRYLDPHNDTALASPEAMKAWLPVDMYVGGAEHAVLHLLYARFWHKVLFDAGVIPKECGDEPFTKLKNQGLILGPDGEKMSKSRGNVINPDEIIAKYGADTLRMYEMFMGPFEDAKPWDTNGIIGIRRFLDKVWRVSERVADVPANDRYHRYVKSVGEGIENFRFNTCVSDLMKWANEWTTTPGLRPTPPQAGASTTPALRATSPRAGGVSKTEYGIFLKLLNPFAPHMTEELWSMLGHETLLAQEKWPTYEMSKVSDTTVTMAVQVMGKLRATLSLPAGSNQADVTAAAMANDNVKKFVTDEPKKVIFVPDKLINFVV